MGEQAARASLMCRLMSRAPCPRPLSLRTFHLPVRHIFIQPWRLAMHMPDTAMRECPTRIPPMEAPLAFHSTQGWVLHLGSEGRAIMAVHSIPPDTFTEVRAFIDRVSTGRDFTDLEFTVAGGSIPVPGHSDPALSLDHTGPGPSAAGIGDGRVATASGSLIT